MDKFFIQTVSDSEESGTSGSSGIYSIQLVPDPESENGWRVEENPSVSLVPVEEVYTEEQLQAMEGVEYASLSERISFLFAAVAGICLVCMLARFLKPRLRVPRWISNSLLAGISCLVFYCRWKIFLPDSLSPLLPVLDLVFLIGVITLFYRGRFSKRIYLAITFLALYELCSVLHLYGERFLVRLCDYFRVSTSPSLFPVYSWVENHEGAWRTTITVGVDWAGCLMLLISCIVLILAVRKLTRCAPLEDDGIPRNELFFLLSPAFTGIVFFTFTNVAKSLLSNPAFVKWTARGNPFFDLSLYFLISFVAAATILCILYAYHIYQKLIAYMQDKQRAALMASQVDQMQDHIREIEQLYTGVRSMRHDMQNYLFDIKSLLAAQGVNVEENGELSGYFAGIGTALDALNFSFHTGNPVTDVVLNGKYQQARGMGIRFDSGFRFPSDYGIDVFDLSIILNNALNNALEACEALCGQDTDAGRFISVTSYCRNNMFLIEVENSFDGVVLSAGHGLLKSKKQDAHRHGLGFQNIVRCAEKYLGSADYTCRDRTFTLTVMLQKSCEPAEI
ncbi:GHKL domain-containing protein [Enterocloster sp. OA13]|uniref:ATP-binding protein n=1 Tax=Enterocloster sp. OA13 TaxID=2914161 RepID=UPI000E726E0C|nr:GHKL domain-containing protein [Enterocloster sp. OA13]RJW54161.1 GHKL domain-containing protein [Clostridiales bacterium TF09-2AC]